MERGTKMERGTIERKAMRWEKERKRMTENDTKNKDITRGE